MWNKISWLVAGVLIVQLGFSQTGDRKEKVMIDGQLLTLYVTECGDTLLLANLDEMSVSAPRSFENDEERRLYYKYRRYAATVYPYAVEAIRTFREVEYFTQDLKRRQKRKRIKHLQRRMEEDFEDPLKKLTKTQGMVLMKMIERELDTPIYFLIKDLRGGITATYWSTLGIFFGHHLRQGYIPGEDPILDIVLEDFDISYTLPPGAQPVIFDQLKEQKEDKEQAESEEEEDR